MASRRTSKPEGQAPRPVFTKPRTSVLEQLAEQARKGRGLLEKTIATWDDLKAVRTAYYTWTEFNRELLRAVFSTDEISKEFAASPRMIYSIGGTPDLGEEISETRSDLGIYVRRLESIVERLPLFEAPGDLPTSSVSSLAPDEVASGRRVFIVHGRDRGPVDACARLLADQGLESVILDEQPNRGRTIIEKFEEHTDVAYAIALLTPDDVGGLADAKSMAPRARQNVILELGFFVGKLGRRHVAALVDPTVEIPSDIEGVLFIPLDPGRDWRFRLAKELKDAGLAIDLNLV